jgi:tellurite resistance protein
MPNRNIPILKAVVCVAWADGLLKDPERRALEGVLAACDLTPEEAAELRSYAAKPRSLGDLDIRGLTPEDRRAVVLHSVALAHADNDYSHSEQQTIQGLCERLGLSSEETHMLMGTANSRQRFR